LRFRIFADLKTMVLGVVTGLQVLFWAVVLLALFIYSMALVMRTQVGNATRDSNEYLHGFRSLPWAMFTLFRCFTDGCSADDGTPLQVHLAKEFGYAFMVGYVFVFLFVTMGIFNLIMANFVDYVSIANGRRSQEERSSNALEMQRQLKDILIDLTFQAEGWHSRKSKVEQACQGFRDWFDWLIHSRSYLQAEARRKNWQREQCSKQFNTNGMMISRHQFAQWLQDPKFLKCLNKLEIETSNKADLFEVLDYDARGVLGFEDIIHGLMYMRGPPQKSDIIAALLGVRHVVAAVRDIRAILENAIVRNNAYVEKQHKGASGLNMQKTAI